MVLADGGLMVFQMLFVAAVALAVASTLWYRAKAAAAGRACARARDETLAATRERDDAVRGAREQSRTDHRVLQSQKMEAVGRLAGGIAHDFNNLLTAITGYSELLITSLGSGDRRLQDAYEIRRAALVASGLTGQLAAFSSQRDVAVEVLDLNAIVARTAGLLKRTLGDHIVLAVDLDRAVKHVKANRGQLEQVVMTLALNARDGMPAGGRLLLETTNLEADPSSDSGLGAASVRLTVTDTGCGIAEATQSTVFDPFGATNGAVGAGIELATVYGIVERIGGSVAMLPDGQGRRVIVELPATDEPIAMAEPSSEPHIVEGCATILLVEDDARVRALAALILQRAGHEVVTAAGAHEALAAFEMQCNIDLVVTDIVMPDMSGFDLADKLRRIAPSVRLVFMSGFSSDQFKRVVTVPFLKKPFTVESLTAIVDQVLGAVPMPKMLVNM